MPRVLIAESDLLLGAVIESILANEEDIDLISITTSNKANLIRHIQQLQPEVVILDGDSDLIKPTSLLAHLNNSLQCRLIVVSANENFVTIFDKQQVTVRKGSRLADLIRCEPGCP